MQYILPNKYFTDNMVFAEGGSFRMGVAEGTDSDECPSHTVTLKSFYISKYEVTQKEWKMIMGNNPSYFKGDSLPVESVSWIDAIVFCNKLSIGKGLIPAYHKQGGSIICDWNADGYRLPTEAEWEFAAKGGINNSLTTEYSGSNIVGLVAWYDGNSGRKTHPVGAKKPNALGLYDMSGNVWEWCWDWYGGYLPEAQTNPKGPDTGVNRVNRGGSWGSAAYGVRSVCRSLNTPSLRGYIVGLRLARNYVNKTK